MRNFVSQSKITLKTQTGILIIPLGDIIYLNSEGSYTKMHLKSDKNVLITQLLGNIEEFLPEYFFRTHKCFIVNRDYIEEYDKINGMIFLLRRSITLPVSRRKRRGFEDFLYSINNELLVLK